MRKRPTATPNGPRGHCSEVVTVSNPAKLIYLSGVNAADEDSKVEVVRNPGDFAAQCRYVWGRIKGMLAKQGATLANVDKAVTYATDPRYLSDNFKCRSEVFAGISQPAGTFVGITGLGTPGMLIEVDVTAHVPR